MKLCDWFDSETDNGKDMTHYDKLLADVLAHIRQSHGATLRQSIGPGGSRGALLPKASEVPQDANDFELVTWLVIAPP